MKISVRIATVLCLLLSASLAQQPAAPAVITPGDNLHVADRQ